LIAHEGKPKKRYLLGGGLALSKSTSRRLAGLVATLGLAGLLAACGQGDKFNRAAYDVCLADAKKAGSPVAAATFEPFEKSSVGGSTGDDYFRVNIPYVLNGQPGRFQCIAEKKQDASFAVVN
jgi:hypothetical protein